MDKNQINFTPRAQKVVKDAKLEAYKLNQALGRTGHLLLKYHYNQIVQQGLALKRHYQRSLFGFESKALIQMFKTQRLMISSKI